MDPQESTWDRMDLPMPKALNELVTAPWGSYMQEILGAPMTSIAIHGAHHLASILSIPLHMHCQFCVTHADHSLPMDRVRVSLDLQSHCHTAAFWDCLFADWYGHCRTFLFVAIGMQTE